MKYSLFAPCLLSAALAACGGGGGDSAPASASQAAVVPPAGTTSVYDETVTDQLNNTINRTIIETIAAVNADGSFTVTTRDPSGNTTFLGAENYTYYPTISYYYPSGFSKQRVTSYPDGTSRTCAYTINSNSYQENRRDVTYTKICGTDNPVIYTYHGWYAGTETVMVPAGIFKANKFMQTVSSSSAAGSGGATEWITTWIDADDVNSTRVKSVTDMIYVGLSSDVPPNSIRSLTQVLRSKQ